jgi:DNA-directed RNA polymerase specialized sigma subunit
MIIQLSRDIKVNRTHYERLTEQLARLRSKLEKSTSNLKDVVVSGSRGSSFDLTLNKIQEIENDLKELDFEYLIYQNEIARLEKIFREFNEEKQLVYLDYKIRKFTPQKIAFKYGISVRTVYRIIKEMEDELI